MVELTFTGPPPTTFADYDSRLRKVLEAARKLNGAGWTVRPTLTGIAIEPPSREGTKYEEIDQSLRALGIEDGIEPSPSRTLPDLGEAEKQLTDRIWYIRTHRYLKNPTPDLTATAKYTFEMLQAMQELETKYDPVNLSVESDYEWGLLNGKLSAIRWVLGDEWDMLDT